MLPPFFLIANKHSHVAGNITIESSSISYCNSCQRRSRSIRVQSQITGTPSTSLSRDRQLVIRFSMWSPPSPSLLDAYRITGRAGGAGTRLSFQEQLPEQYCRVCCHIQKATHCLCCFPCRWNQCLMFCFLTPTKLSTSHWDLSYIGHRKPNIYTLCFTIWTFAFYISQGHLLGVS